MGSRAMHFLAQKPWTPWNMANQRRIFVLEETKKNDARKEKERAEAIARQADVDEVRRLVKSTGADQAAIKDNASHPLNFMYAPPPGLKKEDAGDDDDGDDEEVRKFKAAFAAASGASAGAGAEAGSKPRPRGPQSALEREAGRKAAQPHLSVAELQDRFPFLKGAPMENYADSVKVTFHPLGKVVRNVKCMRCKQYGHESGDKECLMKDQNPQDAARLAREDPMIAIQQAEAEAAAVAEVDTSDLVNLPPSAAAIVAQLRGGQLPSSASSSQQLSGTTGGGQAVPLRGLKIKQSALNAVDSTLSSAAVVGSTSGGAGAAFTSSAAASGRVRTYEYIPALPDHLDPEAADRARKRLNASIESKAAAALSVMEDGWGGVGPPLVEEDATVARSAHDHSDGGGGRRPSAASGASVGAAAVPAAAAAHAEDAFLSSLTREEKEALLARLQADVAAKSGARGAGVSGDQGQVGGRVKANTAAAASPASVSAAPVAEADVDRDAHAAKHDRHHRHRHKHSHHHKRHKRDHGDGDDRGARDGADDASRARELDDAASDRGDRDHGADVNRDGHSDGEGARDSRRTQKDRKHHHHVHGHKQSHWHRSRSRSGSSQSGSRSRRRPAADTGGHGQRDIDRDTDRR